MIEITADIRVDEAEIQLDFVRASGPGGQNVNKVSTAVQLRFDVAHSPSLPEYVRQRLFTQAGKRINKEGVLILTANRYRTQEANREDALERFVELLHSAAKRERRRKRTKPSRASVERRLQHKKMHAQKKAQRRRTSFDDR